MDNGQVYLTTEQVCNRYGGVSKRTISEWRQNRNFPLPAFKARIAFYLIEDILGWEQDNFRLPRSAAKKEVTCEV